MISYENQNFSNSFLIEKKDVYPIYLDRFDNAGQLDAHYFLQDLWFARLLYQEKVHKHYDIGSKIDGFIAHCLSFSQDITLIDIRPFPFHIKGIKYLCADATNMKNIPDNSIQSLSSLHAFEHFGLGRYGDKVDPYGCFKAMNEVQRILKKEGVLYFSVPIGDKEKLCFNAHRIFHPSTIIDSFHSLRLEKFSYIKDMKVIELPQEYFYRIDQEKYGDYACGMFVFRKTEKEHKK